MYFNSKIRRLVSTFFVYSGFSRYARRLHRDQPCILMFHGVREANDPGLLDAKLHVELPTFVEVCENLAANFKVIPLQQISAAIEGGEPLPSGTVALTFDDGYAPNYHLGFPELKRLGLPATIFPATGFLDKTEMLWFLRVEYAVARTAMKQAIVEVGGSKHMLSFESQDERQASLGDLQVALKALPQEGLLGATTRIERELDCALPEQPADWPDMFQPMTWAEARTLQESGLIEFGGHTHRHFILSRCQPETIWREIHQCHARLHAELGAPPITFAYPNGQEGDHNAETAKALREAGFKLALTTEAGFVHARSNPYELPRHGSPLSSHHAEATVSGAFETFKQWRKSPLRLPRQVWS
jgi:peptidoglycan/xylan/chitin deacetylase (PgdA/CDA1 family)